jgi:hypothetical protein
MPEEVPKKTKAEKQALKEAVALAAAAAADLSSAESKTDEPAKKELDEKARKSKERADKKAQVKADEIALAVNQALMNERTKTNPPVVAAAESGFMPTDCHCRELMRLMEAATPHHQQFN